MIPKIAGKEKADNEWHNHSTWKEIPPEEFVYLRDFVADSTAQLFQLIQTLHGKIFPAATGHLRESETVRTPEGFWIQLGKQHLYPGHGLSLPSVRIIPPRDNSKPERFEFMVRPKAFPVSFRLDSILHLRRGG